MHGLDRSQVETLLKKSLTLDPRLAEAHLQLGNLYSDEQKYTESIPEYLRAQELNSDLPDIRYRLGQAYVHTGQKDKAQQNSLHIRSCAKSISQRSNGNGRRFASSSIRPKMARGRRHSNGRTEILAGKDGSARSGVAACL